MRFVVRIALLALVACALVVVSAPAAQASFGVEPRGWFAANCNAGHPECKIPPEKSEEVAKAHEEGYSQAAGHPPFGITDFKLKRVEAAPGLFVPEGFPGGSLKNLRVDVAPGLATNPEAVAQCPVAEFTGTLINEEHGLYTAPKCNVGAGQKEGKPESTVIGENLVETVIEPTPGVFADAELKGTVYNLVPERIPTSTKALSSLFGVAIKVAEPVPGFGLYAHTFIEGNVEWGAEATGTGRADYHDYFEIKNITPGLLRSRLSFKGNIGHIGFLTNPTSCTGPGPQTTTRWHGESYEGVTATAEYTTPIGTEGCNGEESFVKPPFEPAHSLQPETTQSDEGDGFTTTLTLPHDPDPEHVDSSQLKVASVTLPEGMTMNESAAHGLEACTPAQARIHSPIPGVECPGGSKIGTVTINVPGLPPGSLQGNIYLGGPENGPITGPPFTIYLDAESAHFGISVRLKGEAIPNEVTGRLTTIFKENPEQPFTEAILRFTGGALAPVANPLLCGTAATEVSLAPYTGSPAAVSPLVNPFSVDSNGKAGSCASPPPFTPTQSTQNQSPNGGANTSFTIAFTRAGGQQYVAQTRTVLPAGLVGRIPAVTPCEEPQAALGTCAASSQIGVANVEAGAGPTPFAFSGAVYLTGPYKGAPYGLSIAVPAVAGPFNLGLVVTRATINVDPSTARVIVTSTVPRLVKGVLVRIRRISVSTNKQGFLLNPTNCSPLATESVLSGFTLAAGGITGSQNLATPFQVSQCDKLAFKPSFKAATVAKFTKANGVSLETTINQGAGQANMKSVKVQLPLQLPSRLTTLNKACPAATFEADPFKCPSGSFVGGVRANTPVLPAKMKGPAILVSHANASFPDLDLVLEGNGVRVIVVGNTDIKKGITTTTFASTPDVPVSSVTVNLPIGSHSALTGFGNLCARPLVMPTTIVGQNGKTIKQNTKVKVKGCGVRIVGRKVVGRTAYLTLQTFEAGRISAKGRSVKTVFRSLRGAKRAVTLKVRLSRAGLRRHRPFKTRVRVGFRPARRGEAPSAASTTVRFR